METDFYFHPMKFSEVLTKISKSHLSMQEKLSVNSEDSVSEFMARLKAEANKPSGRLRILFKYRDLELIISVLAKTEDEVLRDILLHMLKTFSGSKLFKLSWAMLQKDYTNKDLIDSIKILSLHNEHNCQLYSVILPASGDSILDRALGALECEALLIRDFFDKYGIMSECHFGSDLSIKFFSRCCKSDFLNNFATFKEILFFYKNEAVFNVIENYLEKFDAYEYDFDISKRLLEEYGEPTENKGLWAYMRTEIKAKFNDWLKILQIEDHFGRTSRKSYFWRQYYRDIRKIYRDEESDLLFISFEGFTVVDLGRENSETFLYDSEIFDTKYRQHLDEVKNGLDEVRNVIDIWRPEPDSTVTARVAFLEDASSKVYKMNYDGVGILYLKELIKREAYFNSPSGTEADRGNSTYPS